MPDKEPEIGDEDINFLRSDLVPELILAIAFAVVWPPDHDKPLGGQDIDERVAKVSEALTIRSISVLPSATEPDIRFLKLALKHLAKDVHEIREDESMHSLFKLL